MLEGGAVCVTASVVVTVGVQAGHRLYCHAIMSVQATHTPAHQ